MKKGYIISFLLGLIVMASIGVYAINASEITYKDSNVESALNELYSKSTSDSFQWIMSQPRQANSSTYTVDADSYYLCFKRGSWSASNIVTGGTIVAGNSYIWSASGEIYVAVIKTNSTTLEFNVSNNSIVKIGV